MFRALLSLLLMAVLVLPAAAEDAHKAKKPEPGTTVEMPFLVAPMTKDGDLQGYAYISSKLVCTSSSAAIAVRDKLAFIQDAYVREVNARPVALANDPTKVDTGQLAARLTDDAKRIVGKNKVVGMTFIDIKYAPLHPSGSTEGVMVPPDQAAPQNDGAKSDATAGSSAENK